jgi:hypothetical protein
MNKAIFDTIYAFLDANHAFTVYKIDGYWGFAYLTIERVDGMKTYKFNAVENEDGTYDVTREIVEVKK